MNELQICDIYRRLTEEGKKRFTEAVHILESNPKLCKPSLSASFDKGFSHVAQKSKDSFTKIIVDSLL